MIQQYYHRRVAQVNTTSLHKALPLRQVLPATQMPNSQRASYRETVVAGVVQRTKYLEFNIYDKDKRGTTTAEKFYKLQVRVNDENLVNHTWVGNHLVADIVQALREHDCYFEGRRIFLWKFSAESTLDTKADNRPATSDELAGWHDVEGSNENRNVLRNGQPRPHRPVL